MKNYPAVREVFHSLLDFLYPPACPVCGGSFAASEIICHNCTEAITECAYNYISHQRDLKHVERISILLPYNPQCRKIVHALKYNGMHSVGLVLGELMAKNTLKEYSFTKPSENPCLVPVPLHPSKLNDRGYNQSERLAEGFTLFTGFEICDNVLCRIKQTGTQTALDPEQRMQNVRNAFRYTGKKSLSGRPVILIDDVMTTGSTISECATALKEGGCGDITVCVVATPEVGMD